MAVQPHVLVQDVIAAEESLHFLSARKRRWPKGPWWTSSGTPNSFSSALPLQQYARIKPQAGEEAFKTLPAQNHATAC